MVVKSDPKHEPAFYETALIGSSASRKRQRTHGEDVPVKSESDNQAIFSVHDVLNLKQVLKAKTDSIGHLIAEVAAMSSTSHVRKKLLTTPRGGSGRVNTVEPDDDEDEDGSDGDRNESSTFHHRRRLKKSRPHGTFQR